MSKRRSDVTWVEWMGIFFIGGGLYLFFEHPLIFWLIALPLTVLLIGSLIKWLSKY